MSVRGLDGRPPLGCEDQDGAEVVDVGQGRAGDELAAERREEAVPVVVGQACLSVDLARGGAGQGVRRQDGAGDLLGPVLPAERQPRNPIEIQGTAATMIKPTIRART
jgi:hypothetical protein